MESIVQIRQMMADQKFLEVQRLIEVQLASNNEFRHELLLLYLEALESLDKVFPTFLALELAEIESQNQNHDFVLKLLTRIDSKKHFLRVLKLKLKATEAQGQMDKMYQYISDFFIHQFEYQIPFVTDWIPEFIAKYFRNDFNLNLKQLALTLQLNDIAESEKLLKGLITSCIEKSSPKGTIEKLTAVGEILLASRNKAHLEIYQNFCLIFSQGLKDKTDYKRLVEMVIYFEDFKFQVLLLNLLHLLGLSVESRQYALTVRKNPEYDFVYFDKYFSHLKTYFIELPQEDEPNQDKDYSNPDLKLSEQPDSRIHFYDSPLDEDTDEVRFLNLLKYQTYTPDEFCDLAVSFLQSEMPRVALKAAELAVSNSIDEKGYLKGAYLKLTSLLLINDNWAALDTCIDALEKSRAAEDVLSFLYGQAEALIRLGKYNEAKKTLVKVLSIDSKYRMARERLEKL